MTFVSVSLKKAHEIPPIEVSKWLDLSILMDLSDLEKLFSELGNPDLVRLGGVVTKESALISVEEYLQLYSDYLKGIGSSTPVRLPAVAMTKQLDAFALCPVNEEKYILKQLLPVIELKEHALFYSELEGKFRSGIFGRGGIQWGITFAYPQFFVDQETKGVIQLLKEGSGNSLLFKSLQSWVRRNSDPTPITLAEQKIRLTARIGKGAHSFAKGHPGLSEMGAAVDD